MTGPTTDAEQAAYWKDAYERMAARNVEMAAALGDVLDQVECPRCQGQGVFKQWPEQRTPEIECDVCDGRTYVTERQFHAYYEMRKP